MSHGLNREYVNIFAFFPSIIFKKWIQIVSNKIIFQSVDSILQDLANFAPQFFAKQSIQSSLNLKNSTMKKVLSFVAIALILGACNSVAKFKPMIDELATNWDSTTSQITEFANSVKTEQANWTNATTTMTVAPEAMAKWDDAAKAKYEEIKKSADASSTGISGITTEVDSFISAWKEKSNQVQALKDGLAAGKIEGDVKAQIADLTASATDASSKLADWKTKFDSVKAAASTAQQQFTEFMASTSAAAPATAGKK